MPKLITDDLVNLENQVSTVATINTNNIRIKTAIENTLSRDGSVPNTMGSTLDMNNNRIANLPPPVDPTDPVRLQDMNVTFVSGSAIIANPTAGDASKLIKVNTAGTAYTFTNVKVDASNNITPNTAGSSNLGTNTLGWGSIFVALNGALLWNTGPTLTGTTGLLTCSTALTLTSGALTLTSGGVNLTNGTLTSTIGNIVLNSGFQDFKEIIAPATPGVDVERVYAKDVSGVSGLFAKDSAGVETRLDTRQATQGEMESGSVTTSFTSPSNQQFHPSAPKAWAKVTGGGTPTLSVNYGISSISRPALGRLLINFTTAFSTINYCIIPAVERTSTTLAVANTLHVAIRNGTQTTTSVELECYDTTATTNVAVDPTAWHFTCMGDI